MIEKKTTEQLASTSKRVKVGVKMKEYFPGAVEK